MKKVVLNLQSKTVGDIELSADIFGIKKLPDLIHQYIRYQNAKSSKAHIKLNPDLKYQEEVKNPFLKKVLEMQGRGVINLLTLEVVQHQWAPSTEIILLV